MCQQVISTLDSVVVCDKATHALWVLEINHTITLRKILIQFRFAQGCKLPTLALVEDVALLVHISSGTCSVYAGRGTELATCSLVLESLSVLLPESSHFLKNYQFAQAQAHVCRRQMDAIQLRRQRKHQQTLAHLCIANCWNPEQLYNHSRLVLHANSLQSVLLLEAECQEPCLPALQAMESQVHVASKQEF